MKPRPIAIVIITTSMVMLATACEGFEHSIEPLELPTAPPQAFQEFGTITEDQEIASVESDSPDQLSPVMESLSPQIFGLDLAARVLPFAGIGAIGVMIAAAMSFARLELVKAENMCIGAIVAGVLGFFALLPFDIAAAVAASELAFTGPVGIALDLLIIFPLELLVLNLHIGFASLAYHAGTSSCQALKPKEYFLPPWGFGS